MVFPGNALKFSGVGSVPGQTKQASQSAPNVSKMQNSSHHLMNAFHTVLKMNGMTKIWNATRACQDARVSSRKTEGAWTQRLGTLFGQTTGHQISVPL